MKQLTSDLFRVLLLIVASIVPLASGALKIDDTHYRFCVMDDATIIDQAVASAGKLDQLPFFFDSEWKCYNGVKIHGTKTYVECQNWETGMDVLMTEVYSGKEYSLYHYWVKGYNGVGYDQKTSIYIEVDAPTGISLDKTPSKMLVGEKVDAVYTLLGDFTPFSGHGYFSGTATITDPEVIDIIDGKLVAKKKGRSRLTVEAYAMNSSYNGSYYIGSASVVVIVTDDMNPTKISLSEQNVTVDVGKTHTVTATLSPSDAKTTITWSSTNKNIATVKDGCITGVGRGECVIEARTSNGLTAKCDVLVLGEEDYNHIIDIADVNRNWGTSRDNVIRQQSKNYYLKQEKESSIVFSTNVEESMKIFISYKFDKNNNLCAAAMSLPSNKTTKDFADAFFAEYDSEMEVIDGVETKTIGDQLITIDTSTAFSGTNLITIGFSYYEPLEERDDCVDLGLSVRWAKNNLGASTPTGIGNFYAWAETSPKLEYWRENYAYCNNYDNQYIFNYTNATTNISGTNYDAATKKLGDGWKMPTLAEVNELITHCTWELIQENGVSAYRVTGPNGNSIIMPVVGWKKQDKEYTTTQLHLAIGECPSKQDEACYVITTTRFGQKHEGSIGQEWKAWGYNIRPVYTK